MIPLRAGAAVLLLLLISGLGITLQSARDTIPVLLFDRSSSMARFIDRTEEILGKVDFPHTVLAFSESLHHESPADTNLGHHTNITRALLRADHDRPSAILLVSDGNHNYGPSPLTVTDELVTPVYCFGVGDEAQTDIAITDIVYPRYSYTGDSITVDIIITSKGFTAGTGRLEISQEKSKRTSDFPLSMTPAKHAASFSFLLREPRTYTFTVEIVPKDNEITHDNNRAVFSVRALLAKLHVLYYTDHLSFNTRFILRSLQHDPYMDLHAFAGEKDRGYIDIFTTRSRPLPSIDAIDVLILDNVNLKHLPWNTLDILVQNGLGVVCMGILEGPAAGFAAVPISTVSPSITGTFPVTVMQPFSCLAPGDEVAPFTSINRIIAAKETAVIIAEANTMPLIAYQRHGRGLVFQIAASDIGTWQFVQAGLSKKDILSSLIADAVRFVSARGENARLTMNTLAGEYLLGETVDVTLESYDRNFKRSGGGDFYLTYHHNRIPFYEMQSGIYRASFTADTVGTLQLRAAGTLRDEALTSNELPITVRSRPIEYEEGLNRELLVALAEVTGGTFQPLSDIVGFSPPAAVHTSTRLHLDTPVTYVFVILLLALEWILRKRRGII